MIKHVYNLQTILNMTTVRILIKHLLLTAQVLFGALKYHQRRCAESNQKFSLLLFMAPLAKGADFDTPAAAFPPETKH